jgi:MerR family transcriptional regulator, light-induced transcriptional regulator
MNKISEASALVSISAAERETGISKDTLRIWERRYGFPQPVRDENGDRAYSGEDVERLRIIKRLIDHGMRPGKVVMQSFNQLSKLSAKQNKALQNIALAGEINEAVGMIKDNRLPELQKFLGQLLLRLGLLPFVTEILTPLNTYVGDAWINGDLQIFQEHAYTEILQNLLRHAILSYDSSGNHPRILLATLPKEHHYLGLLTVEAVLTAEGASCIALGSQLPVTEIVQASRIYDADIVALSFTGNYPVKTISEGLANLRQELPPDTEIWAGGRAISQFKRNIDHVKLLPSLNHAIEEIGRWRQQQRA